MGIIIKYFFYFLIFGLIDNISAQTINDKKIDKGFTEYSNGNYSIASSIFYSIANKKNEKELSQVATIMLAKTQTALGNNNESIVILTKYLKNNSKYLEDAYLILAINFYHLNKFTESISWLESVIKIAAEEKNISMANLLLENVICENISFTEVEILKDKYSKKNFLDYLNFYEAKKYYLIGDKKRALELFEEIIDDSENKNLIIKSKEIIYSIENIATIKFGVFLPLFLKGDSLGRGKKIATEILEGIELANKHFNQNAKIKIELVIRDTERKPVKVAGELQKLVDDKNVFGILGPIFSDETIILGSLANTRGIPLISPTATDTGIASKNKFVFQLNPDLLTRGKIIAQYAIQKLKLSTFAILAPSTPQQNIIANGFSNEIQNLGGRIVADVRYPKSSTDLRYFINTIRKSGNVLQSDYKINLNAKLKPNEIENKLKLVGVTSENISKVLNKTNQLPLSKIFGKNTKNISDSLKIPLLKISNSLDSLEYPINSIDAIFLPITNSKEIAVVTSQLKLYNIETILLGTQEWNAPEILEENSNNISTLYFIQDRLKDDSDVETKFYKKYFDELKHYPTENNLIGYNSMNFINGIIESGALSREEFKIKLDNSADYKGVGLNINLNQNRINSSMKILKFSNGVLTKLGSIELQEN